MPPKSTIALAMGYFGKLSVQPQWAADLGRSGPQGIKDFKDDYDRRTPQDQADLLAGLSGDQTLTY